MKATQHKNMRLNVVAAVLLILTLTGVPSSVHAADAGGKRGARQAGDPQKYSLEQAVSDQAQLHTIAFSGLAFITGDFGASTFVPPGKVCDFFGFQYMRDIDIAQKGHNPVFLNRVAGNIFHILNDDQKQNLMDLASEQAVKLEELARMRLPLIKAFCRELNGDVPQGSAGLDKAAVIQYTGRIFEFDADLSYRRAELFGKVAASLSLEQKEYLGKMKFGDFNSWPALDERDGVKQRPRDKSKLFNVAYMTYASEFFSWYAGSLEADTYFCPERHGTYFGGFYMKDMPAMGKRDYDISTSVTGDSGKTFLELLDVEQKSLITGILGSQRAALAEIIKVRREICAELRKFLQGDRPDMAKVLEMGRRYGELDGELSWYYAKAFAGVNKSLTAAQKDAFVKLRNLDGYKSAPYYIYSQAMTEEPVLSGTDVFFFTPGADAKQ